MGVFDRIRTLHRERALAGDQRAGAWARASARRLQYDFVKRKWPRLLLVLLGGFAFSPVIWLMPPSARALALGAWTATVACLVTFGVVLFSGSTYLLLADAGEQWTREELQSLRRQGWKVVHRVLLRPASDIDHVAIGPAGVFVIETKGGSTDWAKARQAGRIRDAARQVSGDARDIRLFLRPVIGSAPVRSIVALWPSDCDFESREVDGVTVLSGHKLKEWVATVPTGCLGPEEIHDAWSMLDKHLARRDREDLRRFGPPPRTISSVVFDTGSFLGAALVGLSVTFSLTTALGWPMSVVPSVGAAALAALAMRIDRFHYAASGLFFGTGVAVVMFVGITALAVLL